MQLVKTQAGQNAFKERSPVFSARQRSSFILFDGEKTVAQVLQSTQGLGVTPEDIEFLVAHGFLAPRVVDEQALPTTPAALSLSAQERYALAKPMATQLTAALGLRGFMLNLSVESADGHEGLLALLPKIQDAAGKEACMELARILRD